MNEMNEVAGFFASDGFMHFLKIIACLALFFGAAALIFRLIGSAATKASKRMGGK